MSGTEKALDAIDQVAERFETALEHNRSTYRLILWMSGGIFVIGVSLLIIGVIKWDTLILAPSAIITGLLYWPIINLLKIRKANICLYISPALIKCLPAARAADEIEKLLEWLRG
jgi:hypothetical protein